LLICKVTNKGKLLTKPKTTIFEQYLQTSHFMFGIILKPPSVGFV